MHAKSDRRISNEKGAIVLMYCMSSPVHDTKARERQHDAQDNLLIITGIHGQATVRTWFKFAQNQQLRKGPTR